MVACAAPHPEVSSPDFERLLLSNFSREVLAVYADWLEERGEPRGQLIHLQLREPTEERRREEARLIAAHWGRWFGATPPGALQLTWENGFPRAATLTLLGAGLHSLRPLFELPGLRFLQRFAGELHGYRGDLDGVELLPLLEELEWVASTPGSVAALAGRALPSLQWLNLDARAPSPLDWAALRGLNAPRLEAAVLSLRGVADLELGEALGRVPWSNEVDSLTVVLPDARAGTLAAACARSARFTLAVQGAGIPFGHELVAGPSCRVEPRYAPCGYSALGEWASVEETATTSASAGSGRPVDQVAPNGFRRCVRCGSADTTCIFLRKSTHYSERKALTTQWLTVEYQCRECLRFTSYRTCAES